MKITNTQNKRLHALLQKRGLMEMKGDLVRQFTDQRTCHSSEMLIGEANEMIITLEKASDAVIRRPVPKGDAQRKRIISICYQLPEHLQFTRWSQTRGKRVVDMVRLNVFLKGPKSIFKKDLNSHTPAELSRVIVQFENMLYGYMQTPKKQQHEQSRA